MSRRDKSVLALLAFFFAVAATIELYFLVAHDRLVGAATHNPLAHLLEIYGRSDQAYFRGPPSLALALEGFNVVVTQPLDFALAYAIVRARWWRWPLQLVLGSYVTYSVLLYFAEAHLSGFARMTSRDARSFFIFYAANLPWLAGYAWLLWDAAAQFARSRVTA